MPEVQMIIFCPTLFRVQFLQINQKSVYTYFKPLGTRAGSNEFVLVSLSIVWSTNYSKSNLDATDGVLFV